MRLSRKIAPLLGAAALAAAGSAAAAPPLAVRMGLWEARTVGTDSGFLDSQSAPAPQIAAMKQRLGAGTVRPLCVTPASLEDNRLFAAEPRPASAAETCKRTEVAATAVHRELLTECSGPPTRSTRVKIDVISPESIHAEATVQQGAGKLLLKSDSRWVSGDCGRYGPGAHPGAGAGAGAGMGMGMGAGSK